LDPGSGRHVAGLRREEVAALAGISTTWYTWIEQGREITISPEVLVQLGRALQLTPHQIEYMNVLSRPPQALPFAIEPEIPDPLRRLVQSHELAPAYITTPRFDLLVWNEFLAGMFDYSAEQDALSRNVIWRFFFDPTRRQLYVDWEGAAQMFVANFRHAFATYREDPHFEELLEQLMGSADFARLWERWDVLAPSDNSPFLVRHHKHGVCELRPAVATLDTTFGCYISVFSLTQRS